MRVLICSHEADIDGIYSASVALMKYPGAKISFYNYGLDNFRKMFDYVKNESKKSKKGLAIISDLGINDEDTADLALESIQYLNQRQWTVLWVDHHPWQRESLVSLRKIGKLYHDSSGRKCSTEIMYEKVMQNNKMIKEAEMKDHYKVKDQYRTVIQYRLTRNEYFGV